MRAARGAGGTAAMAGPGARWKRHIVRQLRQRDRTQKALFLELVPACECAPGPCKAAVEGTRRRERRGWLLAPEALGLLAPLYASPLASRAPSRTRLPPGPLASWPLRARVSRLGWGSLASVVPLGPLMVFPSPRAVPRVQPSQSIWSLWPGEKTLEQLLVNSVSREEVQRLRLCHC